MGANSPIVRAQQGPESWQYKIRPSFSQYFWQKLTTPIITIIKGFVISRLWKKMLFFGPKNAIFYAIILPKYVKFLMKYVKF